jgi:hypothetical protein
MEFKTSLISFNRRLASHYVVLNNLPSSDSLESKQIPGNVITKHLHFLSSEWQSWVPDVSSAQRSYKCLPVHQVVRCFSGKTMRFWVYIPHGGTRYAELSGLNVHEIRMILFSAKRTMLSENLMTDTLNWDLYFRLVV